MQVIPPDFDRMIDLPGVGPCPRPVDIDQSVTGFADLVSLRIYDFAGGMVIDGDAEGDEVLIVLLAGAATLDVTGAAEASFRLDADGDWAVHLPPDHHYRLSPLADATVAYARARPLAAMPPKSFAPVDGILVADATALRLRLSPLDAEQDASVGLDAQTERLVHLTGPARVDGDALPPAHTLALSPGETARIEGMGEVLAVSALRP